MKNLELKVRLNQDELIVNQSLKEYFAYSIHQKDTYYHTNKEGGRLKLRQEFIISKENKNNYFIYYERPNTTDEKFSIYEFYQVDDIEKFMRIFGSALTPEVIVDKVRKVYIYKNARIHFDIVKGLDGIFGEVEVVIETEQELKDSSALMEEIIQKFGFDDGEKIAIGYRELMLQYQ